MKKRQFILLEVVIGLALTLACIAPFITHSVSLYRGEIARLESIEKERLADWTFTEIKEMLLKNEIPWERIPLFNKTSDPFPLPPVTLQIPGGKSRVIERSFKIYTKGKKPGQQQQEFRHLYIYIFLNKEKYDFRLPVQKIA